MTYARDDLDTLIDVALADIDGALADGDARLPVSNLSVMAVVTSGQCDGLYGYIDHIARQIPWTDATGSTLERWASIPFIRRKQASAASGTATRGGCTAGRVLPAETILQRQDGTEYVVLADATVAADGTLTASVMALDPGAAGNAAAGVKLALTETLAGIASPLLVAGDGLTGGADEEKDPELLQRFLDYWRTAEEGAGPYVKLAMKVAGVTRAWEYEHEMGLGTMTVRFVMDNKPDTIIPTADEVARVNEYMQTFRPPGSKGLYVVAPEPDPLDIVVAIDPDTVAIRAAVEDEIAAFIKREHACGEGTARSRLSEVISAAPGEFRHKIISPADDVARAFNKIAVPGNITWVTYA